VTADAAYTVVFYALAAVVVALALVVVNARHLLRAAVSLMGVLAASAGLYVMLAAEFIAGVQVLVYVGGIVVVIVFAITLTSSTDLLEDNPSLRRKVLGGASSIGFMVLTIAALAVMPVPPQAAAKPTADTVGAIGAKLLDPGPRGYVLAFEVISLLLLAAIIGGIVIARRNAPPARAPFGRSAPAGQAGATQEAQRP